jgi:hypothetical protein
LANVSVIALLNLVSAVVALAISYYAYKNNRVVGSILLKYISVGFLLLGISLFMQAGTERLVNLTPLDAVRLRGLELLAFITYSALQLVAYGVFAWGYGLSAYARKQVPSGAPVPAIAASVTGKVFAYAVVAYATFIASQVGVIILLLLIVLQGVRVFSHSKSNLALVVLFGFSLIFFGHLLMLGAVVGSVNSVFLVGNTLEFCGFLSLLFFLVWSGRLVK